MNEFMNFFQTNIWAFADALVTLLTIYGVWCNRRQNKKQLEEIKIFIKKDNVKKELPTYILRKNFTRAELKGILSELHDSKEFYKIQDITSPSFLKKVVDIQKGDTSKLVINIYENDFFEYKI